MTVPSALAALLAELLRDPTVAAALRDALAHHEVREVLPLRDAARVIYGDPTRTRPLLDAGRRGQLAIEGPRNARVIRRAELDRWLTANAPRARKPSVRAARESDADALMRSAARLRAV